MLRNLLFLSVVIIGCLQPSFGQNAIGSKTLSQNSLTLYSAIKTDFRFEETDAVTVPVLQIGASFSASLSDVLSEGPNGEIYLQLPKSNSNDARNIHWNVILMVLAITLVIPSTRKTAPFLGCLALLAAFVYASSNDQFQVTLQYPPNYQFQTVQLLFQDGSVSSSGAVSVDFLLAALNGTSSTFSINDIAVGSQIHVDVAATVNVTDFVLAGASGNFTSRNGDVLLSFRRSFEFRGLLSLSYQNTLNIPVNCTLNSSNTGYCIDPQGDSSLLILAAGSVTILYAPLDCNAFATSDFVPPSPPIDSSLPGYSWSYDDFSQWEGSAAGSAVLAVGPSYDADGGFFVNRTTQYLNDIWAVYQTEGVVLPIGLFPGRSYRISFSYRQAEGYNLSTVTAMSIRVWKLAEYGEASSSLSRILGWPPSDTMTPRGSLVAKSEVTTDRIPSNWTAVSWEFSVNSLATRPYFGLFFNGTVRTILRMKDVKFEILETAEQPQPQYSNFNGFAVIPEMPLTLEDNPRTDCPHLQANLSQWEDASIWPGGVVPTDGSAVTLPDNTKVLIGPCSLAGKYFDSITIPVSSELIFADSEIDMNVGTIYVEGAFRIGSPTCRLFSNIKITFYGTWADRESFTSVKKGIVVYSGATIEIFGKQYNPTWTRLSSSAIPGSDRIYVQHPVNWEVGQQVLLVTSYMKDQDIDMNELMIIKSIQNGGKLIQFESPIRYYHHAGQEYQTEVALLSRRILLQGDENSANIKYGGHVMIMGEGRIAGVELYRMGQNNTLGRYPLHFHMMDTSPESYFKDNSVHDSYFRCYTIHGTHQTLVTRNIAFNAVGHCFYLEDGVEENNTISFNLAVRIQYIPPVATSGSQFMSDMIETPDRILPADSAASGFYISDAQNYIQGNAASGGWAGFALPLFQQPTGLHRYMNYTVKPKDKPSLLFDGNTAHSSGYNFAIFGGCIYSGGSLWYSANGTLTYNGGRGATKNALLQITNYKGWLCGQGANHWGNDVNWYSSEVYDSGRGTTMFGPALLKDSLFAITNNPLGYPPSQGTQGFQFYDQWSQAILSNVTFRNYHKHATLTDPNLSNNCLSVLNNGVDAINQGISAVQKITFDNCDPEIQVASTNNTNRWSASIVDWDGSVSGIPGGAVIGGAINFWKAGDDCVFRSDWQSWVCPRTTTNDVANILISVPGYTSTNSSATKGTYTLFGNDTSRKIDFQFYWSGFTGPEGEGWYLSFPSGMSPRNISILPNRIRDTAKIIMAIRYPANTNFSIWYRNTYFANPSGNYSRVSTLAEVTNSTSKYVYYFDNQHLYLTVWNYLEVGQTDFTRENVTVWAIDGGSSPIKIEAQCDDSATPGWCNAPFMLPPSIRT